MQKLTPINSIFFLMTRCEIKNNVFEHQQKMSDMEVFDYIIKQESHNANRN